MLAEGPWSCHNGTDSVYDILCREIETGGDPSAARGLFRPVHHLLARKPELYARRGMDGIVNAAVKGHETPQHLRIGSIDDGVYLKAGNVALPLAKRLTCKLHHAFLRQLHLQLFVLHPQELL